MQFDNYQTNILSIITHKKIGKKIYYLIQWKSHTKMKPSWVPYYIITQQAPLYLKMYKTRINS